MSKKKSSDKPGTSKDKPSCSNDIELDPYTHMVEPSPLDRILSEGRSFNAGNWTSDELKCLFDGVHKYGTSKGAVNYVVRNFVKTRSEEEIKAKIDEIRDIIREHKDIIMPEYSRSKWIEKGHRAIYESNGEEEPVEWSGLIRQVMAHHHEAIPRNMNPVKDSLEKMFDKFAKESKMEEAVPVTSMHTAKATKEDCQDIRWPLIYKFMKSCVALESQMPPINELEAAVILKVLDSIEDEASTVPDKEKAIVAGIFSELQMGDFRSCEQDHPVDIRSATQLLVDPLRTRIHGIPEVAAEVELPTDRKPSTSSAPSSSSSSNYNN